MDNSLENQFDKIVKMRKESADALVDYWIQHSFYTYFEYWIVVALFLAPLIILAYKIDKSKIFLFGFFGYSIHVFSIYSNVIGINKGMWNYPIPGLPMLPAVSFDASLVPVTFILVYQWTLKNKKNYYLYAIITSVFFSFIMEPLFVYLNLFKLYGDIHHFHRLLVYVTIALIAKIITNVFIKFEKKQ